MDSKNISAPDHSGVYLMKDGKGSIIYIGKAKSLRKRIRSYFAKNQDYKTQKLVEKITDIEFVLTDNESEAFLLESNLIKRYRPMYNIELKDQQRYTYLRITNEKYPRLLVTRRTRTGKFLGEGKVYGPFTHGSSKLLTIGTLRKAFKIRICKTLPKKACLEYHLGNCEAPCEFAWAQERYGKHIADLGHVLKGRDGMAEFVAKLKEEMAEAAKLQQYERAMEIRDTLQRLGSLRTEQKMEYVGSMPDEDYFGIRVENGTALIMMLKQRHGVIRDTDRFSFDVVADNTFGNFLFQYYTTHPIPKNVITSDIPDNTAILKQLLSKNAGFDVGIMSPKSGKRLQMIRLIMKNIDLIQSSGAQPGLVELQKALKLKRAPRVIECFDISNHGSDYAVGAMSRFIDGVPDKSGYRKFKIKTVQGQDDYAMIAEVVGRRYRRLKQTSEEMPDMVLIDGGPGQLGAAQNALKDASVSLVCISIAKRLEEVFVTGGKPADIPRDSAGSKILQYARDEAHRFGVSYNRILRRIV